MWQQLVKKFDSLIDGVTMYRLLLYYLLGLLAAAIGLSVVGDLHYNAAYIAFSAVTLVVTCWIINKIFAYFFDAPTNPESSILTGLILALIMPPSFANFGFLFWLAAAGLAIASKYILAINKKHVFNPAAIAVVLTAFGPRQNASWWVGTAVLLPFVIVGGVLVARKVRREHMVITFLVATTLATAIFSAISKTNIATSLHSMVLSSPIFFLGFVMLTEPYTSPSTRGRQLLYAAIVGVLIAPQVHIFSFYTTPELALIAGNIFAYLVSHKVKLFPTLKEKIKVATYTADFVFNPGRKFAYQPGQYMEWTLPHSHADSRGSRRYFTLASSPTEPDLKIGVKFYDEGSSFKDALVDMDRNTPVVAAQLTGNFVMPRNRSKKLAFIAGGIGITPFRSMVKYLVDKNEHRSITLLYSAKTKDDLAYVPLFEEARRAIGLNALYVLTNERQTAKHPDVRHGTITAELIKNEIPDYLERTFLISGTHPMVLDMQYALHQLGVHKSHIKTDFFPGYA